MQAPDHLSIRRPEIHEHVDEEMNLLLRHIACTKYFTNALTEVCAPREEVVQRLEQSCPGIELVIDREPRNACRLRNGLHAEFPKVGSPQNIFHGLENPRPVLVGGDLSLCELVSARAQRVYIFHYTMCIMKGNCRSGVDPWQHRSASAKSSGLAWLFSCLSESRRSQGAQSYCSD